MPNATGVTRVVVVGEAPNDADTFDPAKGHLTYDHLTDPTGRFTRLLLLEEAKLTEEELAGVIFTNAVLCLPRRRARRFRVSARQLVACSTWLRGLIDASDPLVVVTMGATALRAAAAIERHRLKLRDHAGVLVEWFGRKLLPLYHAGQLGRLTRSEAEQRADMGSLARFLGSAS